uniref:CBM39 domain-containing protein n=1 Tax=Anopheles maculatus TaxID=74869 RepID=A0A182SAP8_9DIPT
MFRSFVIPCALVVLLVIFEQVSCHGRHHHGRHGHHRHHRGPPHHRPMLLNIAIYDPKGIELSTPRLNSTSQYFAFDLFINNPNGTTPDVSHNTSELVYGKFIVRDTEVIIKPDAFDPIDSSLGAYNNCLTTING